jgi:hypothetical protein
MAVRARFFINSVTKNADGTGSVQCQVVSRGPDNAEWSSYSPSGQLSIGMTRKASKALAFFDAHRGEEVYLDITLANDPTCEGCGEPVGQPESYTRYDGDGVNHVFHKAKDDYGIRPGCELKE